MIEEQAGQQALHNIVLSCYIHSQYFGQDNLDPAPVAITARLKLITRFSIIFPIILASLAPFNFFKY